MMAFPSNIWLVSATLTCTFACWRQVLAAIEAGYGQRWQAMASHVASAILAGGGAVAVFCATPPA